jgi:REP element-mobilizing transposase RayT
LREAQPKLRHYSEGLLRQSPFELEADQRCVVLEAVRAVCGYKNWRLLAAHVRANHAHIIVDVDTSPEVAMNVFKAYASRALNLAFPRERGRIRWARAR